MSISPSRSRLTSPARDGVHELLLDVAGKRSDETELKLVRPITSRTVATARPANRGNDLGRLRLLASFSMTSVIRPTFGGGESSTCR